jgi:hypothetical protein
LGSLGEFLEETGGWGYPKRRAQPVINKNGQQKGDISLDFESLPLLVPLINQLTI